jgi:hypothetical protein
MPGRLYAMTTLFLLFNHRFTHDQEADAHTSLGVEATVPLPPELQELWSAIPPERPEINDYLDPIREWLGKEAKAGDYVLIQGDFGACWLMANFSLERGLAPVYSTTERQAMEEHQPDGSVKLVHHFQHRIFRRYGV